MEEKTTTPAGNRRSEIEIMREILIQCHETPMKKTALMHHIHLSYYIFKDDEIGEDVLKILSRKVAEGVDVRVLLDGMGSLAVSGSFMRSMRLSGIQAEWFFPVRFPYITSKLNFRYHRKIVVVDGLTGFMGGLNTHVINAALAERKNHAQLIIIGERGAAYLRGIGEEFEPFPGITEENKYELALKLKDYLMKEAREGKIGKVILSYPLPISFTFQKVELVKILPATEFFEEQKTEDRGQRTEKVIIESSPNDIIEHLVAEWITQKLYEVFEDSKLSEFAARTIHLEQSYQNLSQMGKALQYQYFRARHSFIDRSMRETFASQLLRRRK